MNDMTIGARSDIRSQLDAMSEEQHENYGRMLAKAEKFLQWETGYWYNTIKSKDSRHDVDTEGKKKACERVGLNFSTASKAGIVAGYFLHLPTSATLKYSHYVLVAIDALTDQERTDLLDKAEAGKWSCAKLRKERDKVLGVAHDAPQINEDVDELIARVTAMLPDGTGKRVINAVANGIKKLANELRSEFAGIVQAKVNEQMASENERIKQLQHDTQVEYDNAIKIKAGVKAFITKTEFKKLRSALHEYANLHPGKKADEAFVIFDKLTAVKEWQED